MIKFLATAALLAASLSATNSANALPLAPLSASDTSAVIEVAGGCGRGFAPGPMGVCRPMRVYGGPVVVVPPVVVRPARICPPGFVFRYGRCRPF